MKQNVKMNGVDYKNGCIRKPSTPDPVDVHVGSRIRLRRTILRISQECLADHLGITFQQVQKYENGSNRVGASRLYAISKALDVEVGYFYEGYEDTTESQETTSCGIEKHFAKRETVDLIQAYYAMPKQQRKPWLEMARVCVEGV